MPLPIKLIKLHQEKNRTKQKHRGREGGRGTGRDGETNTGSNIQKETKVEERVQFLAST